MRRPLGAATKSDGGREEPPVMFQRHTQQQCGIGMIAVTLLGVSVVQAQVLDEDFDTVTGAGGGVFLMGPGFEEINDWDTGITGENAFAGTGGNANFAGVSADGLPSGGVLGSGAGSISVNGVVFDLINEDFEAATGTGSATFLVGGGGPDTSGFTGGWDLGLEGEAAFGGTFDGAVLNGAVTARAVLSGGNPGSFGQIDVDDVTLNSGGWFAGLQFDVGSFPAAAALGNPGFEGPTSAWTGFSNAFEFPDPIEIAPLTGGGAAKMFGAFSGPSGLYQEFATQAGQMITFSAFALTPNADSIGGTANQAQLRIEWRDENGVLQDPNGVELVDIVIVLDPDAESCNSDDTFDPNFAEDTWFQGVLTATAPAGATTARCILWFEQPAICGEGGAVWWDDASIAISGPGSFDPTGISLLADVRGTADDVGETLSTIQLRIEDTDGNRLFKEVAADGNWQALGGTLDTFTEADSTGVPASGVFNPNSSTFSVVVAFNDPDLWGNGGTIDVDNLVLSNDDSTGSFWFAGLFFDELSIPILDPNAIAILDPNKLVLLADVKGSEANPYTLRLEGIGTVSSALDEDLNTVSTDCSSFDPNDPNRCLLLDLDASETFDFTTDVAGISGINAFAGVGGSIFPAFANPGVIVRGLPTGGPLNDGSLEITVQGIQRALDGSWFAGIDVQDQALASADLSQVTLTADLKGTADDFGDFGIMELRLEDANGDRLAFQVLANGAWQSVGGTLDTAVELPAADGQGDGVFNTDDLSYTVVVAFEQPVADSENPVTWNLGGTVEIDNLFLTPATSTSELGRFEFLASGNTSFETTGGFLTAADNITLETEGSVGGLTVLDFENGVPAGLAPQNTAWDTGIGNEGAFSGTFDASLTSAEIETCAACGVDGSQAVRTVIEQTGAGWWSGFFFTDIPMDLSAGEGDNLAALSGVELSAQVNAAGSTLPYGVVELRIEDAETDTIFFLLTTDGTWQEIGGPLSGATRGFADPGLTNGVFDYNQSTYTIAVAITNFTSPQWGSPIDVIIDDIAYTGVPASPTAPDSFTVTATFADEIATWGTDGELTIDNVLLAVVPNCNADQSLDMRDLALAQQCVGLVGCDCADLDGDGDADGDDGIPDAFGLLPPSLVLP